MNVVLHIGFKVLFKKMEGKEKKKMILSEEKKVEEKQNSAIMIWYL